jgi:hypothetical protein
MKYMVKFEGQVNPQGFVPVEAANVHPNVDVSTEIWYLEFTDPNGKLVAKIPWSPVDDVIDEQGIKVF